jgi:hypothetical protein
MQDDEKKYITQIMPEELSVALFDDVQDQKINNLAILLGLSEEKSILLLNEVSNILTGANDYDQLKINLKNVLGLPDNLVDFAFNKLQEIVFNRFAEQISFLQKSLKKWRENKISHPNTPLIPSQEAPLAEPKKEIPNYTKNTEQILNVIKSLSQKPVENTATVISEPVIVKQADPIAKPLPKVEEPKIQRVVIDEKPNKLLQAMTGLQKPKSKIDTLLETYNKKTNSVPLVETEKKIEESDFSSPFAIKKNPSFIQKGEDTNFSVPASSPTPKDVPDILKMKEVREASDQNPKNIRLDTKENYIPESKNPVKYNIVEDNQFKPYQYEKGKNKENFNDKFVDLSEV